MEELRDSSQCTLQRSQLEVGSTYQKNTNYTPHSGLHNGVSLAQW